MQYNNIIFFKTITAFVAIKGTCNCKGEITIWLKLKLNRNKSYKAKFKKAKLKR